MNLRYLFPFVILLILIAFIYSFLDNSAKKEDYLKEVQKKREEKITEKSKAESVLPKNKIEDKKIVTKKEVKEKLEKVVGRDENENCYLSQIRGCFG